MGRPSVHRDHPLFKLRASLGKLEPMTQGRLAQLLSVPVITLQSIEAGRRSLNQMSYSLLKAIELHTGARWDATRVGWLFNLRLLKAIVKDGQEWTPITPELFEAYQEILRVPKRSDTRDLALVLSIAWLEELDKRTPDRLWFQLQSRFSAFVQQTVKELGLGEPKEFFNAVSQDKGVQARIDDITAFSGSGLTTAHDFFQKARNEIPLASILLGIDSEMGKEALNVKDDLDSFLQKFPPPISKKRKNRQY